MRDFKYIFILKNINFQIDVSYSNSFLLRWTDREDRERISFKQIKLENAMAIFFLYKLKYYSNKKENNLKFFK